MDIDRTPYLGTAAPLHARRTASKLAGFALRQLGRIECDGRSYLDLGCGNGFITEHIAGRFDRVVAVDVEPARLAEFRARVLGAPKFEIRQVSPRDLGVGDDVFALVTAFEVLEHVEDVGRTVDEMLRCLRPGGLAVVSVPQVLFPFETHGIQLGGRIIERKIPLLPYLRPLHRRLSIARVFGSRELDRIFTERGAELLETGYAAPQFERAAADGARWESRVGFLRPVLDVLERVPGLRRLVGVSILKAYRKPRRPATASC